jgi:hypothetical protein
MLLYIVDSNSQHLPKHLRFRYYLKIPMYLKIHFFLRILKYH